MNEEKGIAGRSGKNCRDCSYRQLANEKFLGRCTWFPKHKKEKDKDIPPEVVDVGCKHFVRRGM